MNAKTVKLGKFIREQRESRGISQTDLAHLSGTSLNFISQLENGKESVRISKVLDILSSLGIKIKLSLGKNEIEL
ncbi:MAG: type II toxin-antitoxin system Y4mF family antitoxin [Bdellovibrionota bacterium]